jgi:hypothetical protein
VRESLIVGAVSGGFALLLFLLQPPAGGWNFTEKRITGESGSTGGMKRSRKRKRESCRP